MLDTIKAYAVRTWARVVAAYNKARAKLKGWKTALASAFLILVGLSDWLMLIDIRPILSALFGDEAQVGKIMAAIGFIFAALRFATTTGVFTRDED